MHTGSLGQLLGTWALYAYSRCTILHRYRSHQGWKSDVLIIGEANVVWESAGREETRRCKERKKKAGEGRYDEGEWKGVDYRLAVTKS